MLFRSRDMQTLISAFGPTYQVLPNGMVSISVLDPRVALQNMNAVIDAHPEWIVLSRPSVRYVVETSPPAGDSSPQRGTIAGAVVGGVVGVLAVGFLSYYLYAARNKATLSARPSQGEIRYTIVGGRAFIAYR